MFPDHFSNGTFLDVGSLDINGTNRYLFSGGAYLGVDIVKGANVDIISHVHELTNFHGFFDVVISTEMLEHDRYWLQSLRAMCLLCKPGGLIVITAANEKRPEHGTRYHSPQDSPATQGYYKGIKVEMLQRIYEFTEFEQSKIEINGKDIYFYGVRER